MCLTSPQCAYTNVLKTDREWVFCLKSDNVLKTDREWGCCLKSDNVRAWMAEEWGCCLKSDNVRAWMAEWIQKVFFGQHCMNILYENTI